MRGSWSALRLARLVAWSPLGMAGSRRVVGQPRCMLRGPDMRGRPYARIFVQRRDPQNYARFSRELGDHLRAAEGAEPAVLVGRGGVAAELVLAGGPTEMRTVNGGRAVEGGGVGLAAGGAMAVHDRRVELVRLVTHCATQAASV